MHLRFLPLCKKNEAKVSRIRSYAILLIIARVYAAATWQWSLCFQVPSHAAAHPIARRIHLSIMTVFKGIE